MVERDYLADNVQYLIKKSDYFTTSADSIPVSRYICSEIIDVIPSEYM